MIRGGDEKGEERRGVDVLHKDQNYLAEEITPGNKKKKKFFKLLMKLDRRSPAQGQRRRSLLFL